MFSMVETKSFKRCLVFAFHLFSTKNACAIFFDISNKDNINGSQHIYYDKHILLIINNICLPEADITKINLL